MGDLECSLEGLVIQFVGRLVVFFDEAGGVVGEVLELAVDLAFLECGVVDFAEFTARGMEIARERAGRFFGFAEVGRTLTKQLRRRIELLVDFQPGDETEVSYSYSVSLIGVDSEAEG